MRMVVLLLGLLSACASAKPVAMGSSDRHMAILTELPGTVPTWVTRGSSMVQTPAHARVFYGVGSAAGIRNPSLLRSAATERGRAELAAVMETFSASLMKDFQASYAGRDVQMVEQAIKTAANVSLRGSEVVDSYTTAEGTLYVLLQIDFDRVKEILAAEKSGLFTSHDAIVTVDDIFDRYSKGGPTQSAHIEKSSAEADITSPRVGRPLWIDHEDPRFPHHIYLCAQGSAVDIPSAQNAALAGLASIFKASVRSVSDDFVAAYNKTGAPELEVQDAAVRTQVVVDKVLVGAEIVDRYNDHTGFYALACLHRQREAGRIEEVLISLDGQVGEHLKAAAGLSKRARVKHLGLAMELLLQREATNTELRIISADGVGTKSPYLYSDISAAFDSAVGALKIRLVVEGPDAEVIRAALSEGLGQRGYQVDHLIVDADVSIRAQTRLEQSNVIKREGITIYNARVGVTVDVIDIESGKVLGTLSRTQKEGHGDLAEAERRAATRLATDLVGDVAETIAKALKR